MLLLLQDTVLLSGLQAQPPPLQRGAGGGKRAWTLCSRARTRGSGLSLKALRPRAEGQGAGALLTPTPQTARCLGGLPGTDHPCRAGRDWDRPAAAEGHTDGTDPAGQGASPEALGRPRWGEGVSLGEEGLAGRHRAGRNGFVLVCGERRGGRLRAGAAWAAGPGTEPVARAARAKQHCSEPKQTPPLHLQTRSRRVPKSLFNLISSPFANQLALRSSGIRAATAIRAQPRNRASRSPGTGGRGQSEAGDLGSPPLPRYSLPSEAAAEDRSCPNSITHPRQASSVPPALGCHPAATQSCPGRLRGEQGAADCS